MPLLPIVMEIPAKGDSMAGLLDKLFSLGAMDFSVPFGEFKTSFEEFSTEGCCVIFGKFPGSSPGIEMFIPGKKGLRGILLKVLGKAAGAVWGGGRPECCSTEGLNAELVMSGGNEGGESLAGAEEGGTRLLDLWRAGTAEVPEFVNIS